MRLILALLLLTRSSADDFTDLIGMVSGEWGNYQQWEADEEANSTTPHLNLHASNCGPITISGLGEEFSFFYSETYIGGNATNVYRQQLLRFGKPVSSPNPIPLTIFEFLNPEAVVGACAKLETLKALTSSQIKSGCLMPLSRHAASFSGMANCTRGDRVLLHQNSYSEQVITVWDRELDTAGNIHGAVSPNILNKTVAARLFQGYVATEFEPNVWGIMNNVSIWDQGNLVPVVLGAPSYNHTEFTLELAICVFPGGFDGKPARVLKLGVHQRGFTHDGKVVPPAYTWTQSSSNEIGINLRYLQAGFKLVQPPTPNDLLIQPSFMLVNKKV